ncbi:MAG: UbiA family prenyltransferase [Alphaproteobacteria bacterium]|nr:UbiA family prenyltransferase [Alphaproteobacteria bacterium]
MTAFARDIKLAHTVFALPFALAAAWLVSRQADVTWLQLFWILVAMVGARSSAMGFNRLMDRHIDARNPRTANREIPGGRLPVGAAWAITLAFTALLALAAWMLNPLCLMLTPGVLAVLWGYSLTKRFTSLCHVVLGIALGLAPVSVWIALTGTVGLPAVLLGSAVATWVAGFDVLYALQDRDYDEGVGLHSIPVALGERGALVASALLHLVTVGLLAAIPLVTGLGWPYWVGFSAITGALFYEHWIVRPGDLSRLDQAFFAANGWISLGFLLSVIAASIS